MRPVALVLLILLNAAAMADNPSTAILNASTGHWEGELYYLDYQSGERFGIPLRIDASMTPDGATLVRHLTFTDPGVLVHAISLATIDRDSGEYVEAFFREGRTELSRATISSSEYESATEWRLVYQFDGTDDDRPARIRHTVERKGATMHSKKEVRFLDDDAGFFLRNGTEVRLVQEAE